MRTLGLAPDVAARLHRWCRGRDDAPVVERAPPKTLSVQMSLTPEPLPMHPAQAGHPAVGSDSAGALLSPVHGIAEEALDFGLDTGCCGVVELPCVARLTFRH